jgi:hypothetical protein
MISFPAVISPPPAPALAPASLHLPGAALSFSAMSTIFGLSAPDEALSGPKVVVHIQIDSACISVSKKEKSRFFKRAVLPVTESPSR